MQLSAKKWMLILGATAITGAMAVGTSVAANAASVGFSHVIEHRIAQSDDPTGLPTAWPTAEPTEHPTGTPTADPTHPGGKWMKCLVKKLPHAVPTGAPTIAPVPTPMPVSTATPGEHKHHHHHHWVWCVRPHFFPGQDGHGSGSGSGANPTEPGEHGLPGTHKFQPVGPGGDDGRGDDSYGRSGSDD